MAGFSVRNGGATDMRNYKVHKGAKVQGVRIFVGMGIHETEDGRVLDIRELARMLSMGTATIPARPFITDFKRSAKNKIAAILKKHTRIRKGKQTLGTGRRYTYFMTELSAEKAGEEISRLFSQWLQSGSYYKARVPNAPSTIAHKHSDVPLVDTGILADHIDWEPIK